MFVIGGSGNLAGEIKRVMIMVRVSGVGAVIICDYYGKLARVWGRDLPNE